MRWRSGIRVDPRDAGYDFYQDKGGIVAIKVDPRACMNRRKRVNPDTKEPVSGSPAHAGVDYLLEIVRLDCHDGGSPRMPGNRHNEHGAYI